MSLIHGSCINNVADGETTVDLAASCQWLQLDLIKNTSLLSCCLSGNLTVLALYYAGEALES